MKGLWDLTSPEALLMKLRLDLDRMKRMKTAPTDMYAPFDFFVTAFHMLDWVHPDTEADAYVKRAALRTQEPLLEIAGHLANGSKHFEATRWDSVKGTAFSADDNWEAAFTGEGRLTIKLSAADTARYGVGELDMLETAQRLCEFWRQELQRRKTAGS